MSHYLVMVVGEDVERQLSPFDENMIVRRYLVGPVSEDCMNQMQNFYEKENRILYPTFDECYKQNGKSWNHNMWEKDANGVWQEYSNYNPNSKWDWYEVGGRWAGEITLKDGVEPLSDPNFSWGWSEEEKDAMPSNKVDIAYKRDIQNIDELEPFAVVMNGEWYERGSMGWWGCVSDDKGDTWKDEIQELIHSIPDDELITMVDCHI